MHPSGDGVEGITVLRRLGLAVPQGSRRRRCRQHPAPAPPRSVPLATMTRARRSPQPPCPEPPIPLRRVRPPLGPMRRRPSKTTLLRAQLAGLPIRDRQTLVAGLGLGAPGHFHTNSSARADVTRALAHLQERSSRHERMESDPHQASPDRFSQVIETVSSMDGVPSKVRTMSPASSSSVRTSPCSVRT
jgi:hypothetical protein